MSSVSSAVSEPVVSEPVENATDVSVTEGTAELETEKPSSDSAIYLYGQPLKELPKDLYIPPEALEVILEAFEGPLDLLLYLIKKQNLDILDIAVSEITRQYMEYVQLISTLQLELAAEYLVMAATLGEIKSRCLLPRPPETEDSEEDPRMALIKRLQNYERFKMAAEDLDQLPRVERDTFLARVVMPKNTQPEALPDVLLKDLLMAFKEVVFRAGLYEQHKVQREALSTRDRMSKILDTLRRENVVAFFTLFELTEGRSGVVVTFLAALELIKEGLVSIVQQEAFAPIYLKSKLLDETAAEIDEIESAREG